MVNRDLNSETKDVGERNYFYGFDYDVMHPFMLRSFEAFFRQGSALELGCFEGAFSERLLPYFEKYVAVEGASDSAAKAAKRLGSRAEVICSAFEEVELNQKFDNIILTHVLEHLDDPVALLRKINTVWLKPGGRLFLVCPNANAPSRQIAVKMGIISHNSAVTPAEKEHGHRRTYALDTLERDASAGGLKIIFRTGIFFKALANFQWDKLLQTDIVSKEYLEGCYQLGHVYPDLCSSIFLLCEQGE